MRSEAALDSIVVCVVFLGRDYRSIPSGISSFRLPGISSTKPQQPLKRQREGFAFQYSDFQHLSLIISSSKAACIYLFMK